MAKASDAQTEAREIALRGTSRAALERALAEAYAAGASGCEEREESEGRLTFLLYAPAARADAVWRAAREAAGAEAEVAAPRALAAVDWSQAWKAELVPIAISPRLAVRPSCAEFEPAAGQQVLVVDPGQAFGTGAHESTRLALEWVAERAPALAPGARVLDVGTGSGVLALAALALAPARAFAFDLDPLAAPEARINAQRNGLGARLALWTGGLGCLAPGARFELVVANLLWRELEPLWETLAACTSPGGELVVSGQLVEEGERVIASAGRAGFEPQGSRERVDASGARWQSWLMRRRSAPASRPARGAG
jgi:ribosomal protein L11 methyltransferase